jgi:lipopolysaccharide export system protein LptC
MRLILEIALVAALIWFGWEKPFKERIPGAKPADAATVKVSPVTPARRATAVHQPVTTSTPSGDWMWDPAHRSTLDRPAYDSQKASQRYLDEAGRRYWIDGQGVRHYEQ